MNLDTTPDKEHATYSASGSDRWLNCPGSIGLSQGAPDTPESRYAAEGTKAHEVFEFLLKNRLSPAAVAMAKKTFPMEMIDHGVTAVRWVLDQAQDGDTILCETRIDSSFFTTEGQFGTVDAAIVRPWGTLTVIDYKYGQGVVVDPAADGDGNSQLVYYALGISEKYGHYFTNVRLVVIQPRAYTEDGDTIREFTLSMGQLLDWVPRFQAGVERTQAENPVVSPGRWCKFCKAATICPALKEESFKRAQIVFSDDKGLEALPVPTLITLPNLDKMLDACDRLEHWIEKVRDHAFHVMQKGHKVPGWKLVEKRATRKWVDPEAAFTFFTHHYGKKVLSEPELLSPAQIEKAVGGKQIKELVNQHTTAVSSGLTMAPESDKRPAVQPIENVFTEIEGT